MEHIERCSTCESLVQSIRNADRERNWDKLRIMQKLLDDHIKQHRERVERVAVEWKDGKKWIVR